MLGSFIVRVALSSYLLGAYLTELVLACFTEFHFATGMYDL